MSSEDHGVTGAKHLDACDHRKACTLCEKRRDVLVRCQIDPSERWHFVCPGSCWKGVSGGVIDGTEQHSYYRYGGMWKNKHEAVSAKKPKRAKRTGAVEVASTCEQRSRVGDPVAGSLPEWDENAMNYTKNDRVRWKDVVYDCRKSHVSQTGKDPAKAYQLWKEHKGP